MEKHKCPRCGTDEYMTPCDTAQKIGTLFGLAVSLSTRMLGAATGGPAGALAAALAGAVAGQKLGELLDDHVFRKYRCSKCGGEISL
jgi:outer membrane lipoprotein SlyB